MLELFNYVNCPYCLRARIALNHSQIKFKINEIDLKNKPEYFLKISPKGTVPVLILEDSSIIDQSIEIVHYAKNHSNLEVWQDVIENAAKTIIDQFNSEFMPALKIYKNDLTNKNRLVCEKFISYINKIITQNYLFGNKLSTTDIIIFPFIYNFSLIEPEHWNNSNYQNVIKFLKNIINLPSYKKAINSTTT